MEYSNTIYRRVIGKYKDNEGEICPITINVTEENNFYLVIHDNEEKTTILFNFPKHQRNDAIEHGVAQAQKLMTK